MAHCISLCKTRDLQDESTFDPQGQNCKILDIGSLGDSTYKISRLIQGLVISDKYITSCSLF